jgi:tRNA nucleotidyltransferase (CCA-adding enzyme)
MDFSSVLKEIKPTKKEEQELNKLATQVIKKIKVSKAVPMIGGSGAKKTWLRNAYDVDIYVKFNFNTYKDKSENIAEILHKALKKKFKKVTRLHGSRDYFQTKVNNYTFEIVPIIDISKPEQARNTTDFSQLHVKYVGKHVNKNKKLADEIRLTKQFAKANNVYGAESYIRGFSGYVLELLTIHYGSFEKLMKAMAKWKTETIIGKKKDVQKLNPSKESPLIFIDPVQPIRNAAAAVAHEKYYDFIMAARTFLRHKSTDLFKETYIDKEKMCHLGPVIHLDIKPLPGNRDIVGAKILKAFKFMKKQIKDHDFTFIDTHWSFDYDNKKGAFYFIVDKQELPPTRKQQGPPISNKKALQNFKKKHKRIKIANKQAYAIKKRAYTKIKPLISALIKLPEVKKRVKAIKIVN